MVHENPVKMESEDLGKETNTHTNPTMYQRREIHSGTVVVRNKSVRFRSEQDVRRYFDPISLSDKQPSSNSLHEAPQDQVSSDRETKPRPRD